MATSGAAVEIAIPEQIEEEGAPPPSAWRTVIGTVEGRIGLGVGLVMLGVIAFGRFFAPYSPTELGVGLATQGPSADHFFGTDHLGRDVFSRFLAGGDTIVLIPLAAVSLAFVVGGGLGMLGAYLRGRADALITRTFDLLLTLPPLLLVLVLIAGLGTSSIVLVVTVALVFIPRIGRVVRGATQAVVTSDYVAAAQPPEPDWGLMVADSRAYLAAQPWAALAPAFGIAALSVSFNLIADALTRHLTRESARGVVPL